MPQKNRSALRAGLLMLGSVVLILLVVVGVKGLSWISDKSETHYVGFTLTTNIGGLRVGDEVRIGGFKVGEVQRISVTGFDDPNDPNQPQGIVVAFSMPQKYVIREDAKVRVDGTLTGTSWLNFEDMGRGKPLAPKGYLVGGPSPMAELLAKAGGLAPEIQATITDVRVKMVPLANQTLAKFGQTADAFKKTGENATALTADVRASYKPVIEKYNAVADKAVAALEGIRAVFGDSADDFKTTVANLRKTTDAIQAKLPPMLTKVDVAIDGVNKAMVDVQAAMASAKDLTAGAKAVVVGNKTKLDTMIASLKTAGDNLKAATAEIRRSPWRLLYKPAANEMANLNVYDAARQFSEGAGELNDAAGALRDAIKNNQASPEEIKKLMEKVDQSFSNFKQVEDKLWGSVKE